jgi:hypothetical protein
VPLPPRNLLPLFMALLIAVFVLFHLTFCPSFTAINPTFAGGE